MDGCWDMMHSGHYNAIRQAKALGDILVVGIHTNEEIAKNKREPVWTDKERTYLVTQCKWADEIIFDGTVPLFTDAPRLKKTPQHIVPYSPSMALLGRKDISADWIAHGDDMPVDAEGNPAFGEVQSKFKMFKRTPGVSTTSVIQRLLDATSSKDCRTVDDSDDEGLLECTSRFPPFLFLLVFVVLVHTRTHTPCGCASKTLFSGLAKIWSLPSRKNVFSFCICALFL